MRGLRQISPAARLAQVAANGEKPRQDARDIAIENAERHVIGDTQHCSGSVAADSGELQSGIESAGKFSVVMQKDFFCGAVQVARTAVIPEAGPEFQDFHERRASK